MKEKLLDIWYGLLTCYRLNGDGFLGQFITDINHEFIIMILKVKKASMDFRHLSSPGIQKFKPQLSVGNVILAAFCDSERYV